MRRKRYNPVLPTPEEAERLEAIFGKLASGTEDGPAVRDEREEEDASPRAA